MANTAKQQPLLPAYLIVGEDALKREATMRRLRARLSTMGDLSFDADVFDGETSSGPDIVAACNTVPFAGPARLVEVRNVEALGKTDAEALVGYLSAPSETTILALNAEKLAKNTRLYKAVAKVGKSAVIDCSPPKRKDLPEMVRSMAVGYGATMTPAAANRLVEYVGEDTMRLDAEVKKLALGCGAGTIDERDVATLVGRLSEPKPWELTDAFSERDLARCLDLLHRMPSTSPYSVLYNCTKRLRELICTRSLIARGAPQSIAAELKLADWQADKRRNWARNFTDEELRRALVSSRDAESAMKSGADPDAVLTDWLIAVATGKRGATTTPF